MYNGNGEKIYKNSDIYKVIYSNFREIGLIIWEMALVQLRTLMVKNIK